MYFSMKKLFFFFLVYSFFSCFQPQNNSEVNTDSVVNSAKNNSKKHDKINPVKKIFLKKIENWQDYRNVKELLKRYEEVSPNEALNNAIELKDLTKVLKDKIELKALDIPSFQARLNVLHNESLRLADMTHIPAITAEEVNGQVAKILVVFSSINEKINTVFTQKKFEKEIDVDNITIGLDTSKLYKNNTIEELKVLSPSISKKRN